MILPGGIFFIKLFLAKLAGIHRLAEPTEFSFILSLIFAGKLTDVLSSIGYIMVKSQKAYAFVEWDELRLGIQFQSQAFHHAPNHIQTVL